MESIDGELMDFFETGTEGVIWSVQQTDVRGYAGLHTIKAGDALTVYNEDGSVRWEGVIEPDYEVGWTRFPQNPQHGQQVSCGRWVHWIQRGFTPDEWGDLFFRHGARLRGRLVRA